MNFLPVIAVSLSDKCPLVPALQGEENKTRKERRAEEEEKSDPRNANSPTCTLVSKLHIQQSVLTWTWIIQASKPQEEAFHWEEKPRN